MATQRRPGEVILHVTDTVDYVKSSGPIAKCGEPQDGYETDPASTGFVFPDRDPGDWDGAELAQHYLRRRACFGCRCRWAFPVFRHVEGPRAPSMTLNTRAGALVHSLAAYRLKPFPTQPSILAGHSLGQLSALCAGGALALRDGLLLVRGAAN
jgi:hypothetical protein